MIKYIDFDGVIKDTENGLFDEYYILKKDNPNLNRRIYLAQKDWYKWLRETAILNDSLNILKSFDPTSVPILTKVHSISEGIEKIKYLREENVTNNVILVPYDIKKSQVVSSIGNILVDDTTKNLIQWKESGGTSIFYSKEETEEFPTIYTLETVLDDKKLQKILKR